MADRNQIKPESDAKKAPGADRNDSSSSGRDDDLEKNPNPDSEKSSASRPRGHTEEPDRTL